VAVRSGQLEGRLALAPNVMATFEVPLLRSASLDATQVSVESSDAGVATGSAPDIPAGGTSAFVQIDTHSGAGTAFLRVEANGELAVVEVAVGEAPSGSQALASPPGAAVKQAGSAGTLYLPAGTSLPVTVPLRPMYLNPADVDALSRDPGVATVTPDSFALAPGETEAEVMVTTVADGETAIIFQVGDDVRALRVVVGQPAPGEEPFNWAPQPGVCVGDPGGCPQ
jgi:hypothetical protein